MAKNATRIYSNREFAYDRELILLKECKTSERNKELILAFQNDLFAKGAGQLRVSKLGSQLRRVCLVIDKDLDRLNKEDLVNLIGYYNRNSDYSDSTKVDYRRVLKQFYKWFRDNDRRLTSEDKEELSIANKLYAYVDKEIRSSCPPNEIAYSAIITEEDIDLVTEKGCRTIKERAFLQLLHETGCRAGEFLNIKLKDIELSQNRALIVVDGKTGIRRVPIVRSLSYLVQWISIHPFRDDKEAYLWVGESSNHLYDPLKHKGGQKIIDRCFNRAGVFKRHNFHWLRHSRATILAPKITESLLCQYMGWRLGSDQVRVYVHLCVEQLENAVLMINGLKKPEEDNANLPKKCVCGAINPTKGKFCYRCGNPLDITVILAMNKLTENSLKKYVEIVQDPSKKEQFEKFKQALAAKEGEKHDENK